MYLIYIILLYSIQVIFLSEEKKIFIVSTKMFPPWHFLYLLTLLSYLFLCILLNIISFFLVNLVKSIVGKRHWILSAFRNGDQ